MLLKSLGMVPLIRQGNHSKERVTRSPIVVERAQALSSVRVTSCRNIFLERANCHKISLCAYFKCVFQKDSVSAHTNYLVQN